MKGGKKLLEEKRFTEAILFFENLQKKDPLVKEQISAAYSFALRKQAAKLIEKNEPEKAKRLLLKSEGTSPADAIGHYMLGRIYADEKDYERAVLSYKNAIKLDENMARAYFNLGYIYYVVKKDYVKAQEMYERTVQISPDFLDDALYMLALSQKRLGKKQECISNLEKSLNINPDNKQAKTTLARLKKL
jgi:tetratricopeptide (TPR) repeat protein